jgi:hypothetical protein
MEPMKNSVITGNNTALNLRYIKQKLLSYANLLLVWFARRSFMHLWVSYPFVFEQWLRPNSQSPFLYFKVIIIITKALLKPGIDPILLSASAKYKLLAAYLTPYHDFHTC